jgi:hypothetical protein
MPDLPAGWELSPDQTVPEIDPGAGPAGSAAPHERSRPPLRLGNPEDILAGLAQGVLDPIEGIGQLIEHATGKQVPLGVIRKWANALEERAHSSILGNISEFGGNLAYAAIPGAFGAGGSSSLGALARIAAGAGGGLAAPVESDKPYWRSKLNQAAIGAVGGGLAGPIANWSGKGVRGLSAIAHAAGTPWPVATLADIGEVIPWATKGLATGVARAPRSAGLAGGRLQGTFGPTHYDEDESSE